MNKVYGMDSGVGQRNDTMGDFWCDYYHLTMAQGWFLSGKAKEPAVFEMFIRRHPFQGGYTLSAGMPLALGHLANYGFDEEQLAWMEETGEFKAEFINFLKSEPLQITVDAFPEGSVVFPNEPIARVSGPLWQVSFVESAMLNAVNFQSLIATKVSRMVHAAGGKPVAELGLRRAEEAKGENSSRAAAIGGAVASSNVDAVRRFGLQRVGTMAHSWVKSFDSELEAFKVWLTLYPDNATLLIDTYDILQGVKNAIRASVETGVRLQKIRIDSGDLNYYPNEARKILDEAGFGNVKIVLSNDLDEYIIEDLERQGAKADIYGVGTNAVAPDGSVGAVFKLKNLVGVDKIKISSNKQKTSVPGATELVRIVGEDGMYGGDVITQLGVVAGEAGLLSEPLVSVNPDNEHMAKTFPAGTRFIKPMRRMVEDGVILEEAKSVAETAEFAREELSRLDASYKRFRNPHVYVAGLEAGLAKLRAEMMQKVY